MARRPVGVWRAGVSATITEPYRWPNPEAAAMARPSWDTHKGVKDAIPPPAVRQTVKPNLRIVCEQSDTASFVR